MILGCDVSHWNGPGDWAKAKAAGIKFAFIRAGSVEHATGKLYEDDLFRQHAEGAKQAGIPRGYYWYFRPYHEPIRQSEYFLKLANEMEYELPFVCDAEYSVGLTPLQNAASIRQFMNDIANGSPDFMPIIYTRQSWWDISVNPISPVAWKVYDLWPARWSAALTSPWSDGRFEFRDWDDWKFWQFSGDNNGRAAEFGFTQGDPDLDLNWYNGDEAQFNREFGLTTQPPPPTLEQRVTDLERRVTNLGG